MRRSSGLSLLEVLIALVVIVVAFFALAMSQLSNLKASSRAKAVTEVKAAANRGLESLMAQILAVENVPVGSVMDDTKTQGRSFHFIDYYYRCPTVQSPQGTRGGSSGNLRAVGCSGTTAATAGQPWRTDWRVAGEAGPRGEGVLLVTVQTTHANTGNTLTLVSRVTCYDVYPSPKATTPEPCPRPTASGGGRL